MHRTLVHTTALVTTASSALVASSIAVADKGKAHLDVWLRPTPEGVFTGAITEGTPGKPVAERANVFAGTFGEDPKFPYAAFEPGLQALATGFPTTFAFEIAGPLRVFDGAQFVATSAAISIAYGPSVVTTGVTEVPGFAFTTFADGLLHDHFDYLLEGAKGAEPANGVYALPLRFSAIAPSAAPGNVAWIVLNAGEDEATHEAAERNAALFLACEIDLTGDGIVGAEDLAALLGAWAGDEARFDLDGSGAVGAGDLALLLGAWGTNCAG